MTTITLAPTTARHTHHFLMETPEAAIQRQPDVAYGDRTVLGSCRCGATTQAKAAITGGTSFVAGVPDELAA